MCRRHCLALHQDIDITSVDSPTDFNNNIQYDFYFMIFLAKASHKISTAIHLFDLMQSATLAKSTYCLSSTNDM